MRHAWLLWIALLAIVVAVTFEISARRNPWLAAARPRIFAFLLLYSLIVLATPPLLHSLDRPFDYAATAAAPPVRLGVFGAWTAMRTGRVEGQRFNCQADAGPLDPAPPGAHPWARARLAVYVFPGAEGRSTVAFWVRRMLPLVRLRCLR